MRDSPNPVDADRERNSPCLAKPPVEPGRTALAGLTSSKERRDQRDLGSV